MSELFDTIVQDMKNFMRARDKQSLEAVRLLLAKVKQYRLLADWILFDAKPSPNDKDALPGGNALSFDWKLLTKKYDPGFGLPWLLSGGLNIDNLYDAVSISGARAVDVSSGVESSYGKKDPILVKEFLKLSAGL